MTHTPFLLTCAAIGCGFGVLAALQANAAGDPHSIVQNTPGLVAFWDFKEAAGHPRVSTGTKQKHALQEVGGPIARVEGGPFSGYSAELDGTHYFKIPHAETGDLNIGGPGAQVSMFAVVRIVNLKQSRTIAGMWSEGKGANDDTGTRQYSLLMNMPTYGGPRQLTPHISSEGGVTRRADGSAFPWCADYAATRSEVPEEKWCSLMGIMFAGNNLVLEYNHIRHMNLETEDTGAVYTGGRDWLGSRGSVIRYNYFHDILGYGRDNQGRWLSPHFAWGVYLDDNTGGVDVIANIVVRAHRAGLHLHNGRDNHIINNLFIDSTQQQMECSGWTDQHRYWSSHFGTMIQGFESVQNAPAWRDMRRMNLHPTNAVLPDGKIMSGNVFLRNIIAYREPAAKYASFRTFPHDHNVCDSNLVWHGGLPLLTGERKAGREISANFAPNPGFEDEIIGGLPRDWQWLIRPTNTASVVTEGATSGRQALRLGAALVRDKPRDNYPILVSREFPLTPGKRYRLTAKLRTDLPTAEAGLMLQSSIANTYFWASSPNEAKVGPAWKDFEFTFQVPGPGDKNWHEHMATFRVRLDWKEESGALFADEISLKEVESLDEWASWQALGMDRHSLIADPLFVNAAKDDYRLQPNSPAFQLGFQPIPVEKIGP